MRRVSPRTRLWRRTLAVLVSALAVGLIALMFRALSAGGVFADAAPQMDSSCRTVATLPVAAIAADPSGRRLFLAVSGAGPEGGIYAYVPGTAPQRLTGTPVGFHPVALTLGRAAGGGLLLTAGGPVSARTGTIVQFALDDRGAVPVLKETATIGSSLFAHLTALTAAGPGGFYAADAPEQDTDFLSLMAANLRPGKGRIIYYDGQMPHVVAEKLLAPRGLALSADGSRLFVAAEIGRSLDSYDIAPFTGRLTAAAQYDLPLAPAQLNLDGREMIIAGDPNLFARDAYRHHSGAPSPSEVVAVRIEADNAVGMTPLLIAPGARLAAAAAAARIGDHLVIGSVLGRSLTDCRLR